MAKFKVTIGDDFVIEAMEVEDIDAIEALAAIAERRAAIKRETSIAFAVLGSIVLALIVSATLGWIDGSYDELGGVWSASSIWVGAILGRYFKKE